MITGHFVPDTLYGSSGRSFQFKWLIAWLRYSRKADGGFCLACVLFSKNSTNRADTGVLFKTALTDFKRLKCEHVNIENLNLN